MERSLSLLNEESQRRADGQTRDPEAIREADLAERAAAAIAKGKKPNIKGLSFETLDPYGQRPRSAQPRSRASPIQRGCFERPRAQGGCGHSIRQGQQQPGIQSAMRGWNAGQTKTLPNLSTSRKIAPGCPSWRNKLT